MICFKWDEYKYSKKNELKKKNSANAYVTPKRQVLGKICTSPVYEFLYIQISSSTQARCGQARVLCRLGFYKKFPDSIWPLRKWKLGANYFLCASTLSLMFIDSNSLAQSQLQIRQPFLVIQQFIIIQLHANQGKIRREKNHKIKGTEGFKYGYSKAPNKNSKF